MRWSRVFVYILVSMSPLLSFASTSNFNEDRARHVASSLYERAVQEFVNQQRMFLDGFGNGTAILENRYDDEEDDEDLQSKATGEGEGRGRRKRLRQMNRTLMAMVMAFALKFVFLVPTFIGTLILLKFTTALAGFFYALFAAVLGLDQHRDHHHH